MENSSNSQVWQELVYRVFHFVFVPSKEIINQLKQYKIGLFSSIIFIFAIFTYNISNQILFSTADKHPGVLLIFDFVVLLVIFALGIFIFSAWIHFASNLINRYGNVKDTINLLLISFTPLFLSLPMSTILTITIKNPALIYVAVSVLIYFLILLNMFLSVKENYSFTSGQTLLVFVLPILIIEVLILFFVMAAIFYISLMIL